MRMKHTLKNEKSKKRKKSDETKKKSKEVYT